jgi:RNA polymerase sigma factor (sigma-70 family)
MQEDAEELVQDVFESLWERRETIQIDSLRHYLFSSVRYMVIRYISKKKVKQRYADHFLAFESLYYTLEEHDNESSSIRNRILEVMREMPERCQLAIKLRITENLSNSEIASRMNITKKTVELYMSKALSHLRTALRGAEFFIFLGGSIGYYTHLLALTNP